MVPHVKQIIINSSNLVQANDSSRTSVASSAKKTSRGSPKASSARELIERKGAAVGREERAATLPRKGALYNKKENTKLNTLPRHNKQTREESGGDMLTKVRNLVQLVLMWDY